MAMLLPLLLFTSTCALAADKPPPYGQLRDSIQKTFQILDENVLSMEDSIPNMDDPRRHYAQIMCVVYAQAVEESACSEEHYFRDYQAHLNSTFHIGIDHPYEVVKGIRWLISEIKTVIDDLMTLIDSFGKSSPDNDRVVHENMQNNKTLERTELVFITVGLASVELNKMHVDYFGPRSKYLSSNKFVITGARKLKKFVMAVHDYHKAMYGLPKCPIFEG